LSDLLLINGLYTVAAMNVGNQFYFATIE